MFHSQITGTGSYLPQRIVTNDDLSRFFTTSDAWIRENIGIEERRFVEKGVGASDLALQASLFALKKAGKTPEDIDAIVFATSTPDFQAPGSGVLLQNKLGCHKIPAFDVHNTSPGFLFALDLADGLIKSKKYSCILIVGSEVHSTGLDFSDRGRKMSVIFGDGAGAVVLEPTEEPHGVLSLKLHSDGQYFDKLWCEAPASKYHPRLTPQMIEDGKIYPTMDGKFVFENAVKCMSLACEEILAENNLDITKVDWLIPHQANLRIIEAVGKKLSIPTEKVVTNIQKYGNTSSASIPIALDEAVSLGKIQKGHLLLLTSFGSGFSWGAGLVKW